MRFSGHDGIKVSLHHENFLVWFKKKDFCTTTSYKIAIHKNSGVLYCMLRLLSCTKYQKKSRPNVIRDKRFQHMKH